MPKLEGRDSHTHTHPLHSSFIHPHGSLLIFFLLSCPQCNLAEANAADCTISFFLLPSIHSFFPFLSFTHSRFRPSCVVRPMWTTQSVRSSCLMVPACNQADQECPCQHHHHHHHHQHHRTDASNHQACVCVCVRRLSFNELMVIHSHHHHHHHHHHPLKGLLSRKKTEPSQLIESTFSVRIQ